LAFLASDRIEGLGERDHGDEKESQPSTVPKMDVVGIGFANRARKTAACNKLWSIAPTENQHPVSPSILFPIRMIENICAYFMLLKENAQSQFSWSFKLASATVRLVLQVFCLERHTG
jgi:hypothetical protein